MGFRVRKSIQIVPGVRMNISKSGVGYSVGGRGYRVTKRADGRVNRTVGLPGTGISHTSTVSGATRNARAVTPRGTSSATPTPLPAPAAPPPPKPGLLAPAWEKDLYQAVQTAGDLAVVARKHGAAHADVRVLAAALDGLCTFTTATTDTARARARELLAWVIAQPTVLATHPFVTKYLPDRTWSVEIAAGITADLRIGDDAVLLAAAELHQAAGDLDTAIWTLEHAQPTATAALSLGELYSDADRDQDLIDLTTGLTNQDDATALLLALRGRAFAHQGFHDAGREAIKQSLANRSRSTEVRYRAMIERAQISLAQGRKASARKDLETVLAADPNYPGLQDQLSAL